MRSSRTLTFVLNRAWNATAILICLLVVGCGGADHGTPVSVSGKVTLDGESMPGLTVIYHNTGGLPAKFRTQRATTDAQGTYSLPEVYPGDYTILFEKTAAVPDDPGMAPATESATDASLAKYSGDNAPTASVSENTAEINFELDSQLILDLPQ